MNETITFDGEDLNLYSCASYYVECCVNHECEIILSKATCFFYRKKDTDELFLITNWHVVTGKNPLTGVYLNTKAAMPTYLKLKLLQALQIGDAEQLNEVDLVINLYSDEIPLWRELKNNQDVIIDVVALPCNLPPNYIVYPINELEEPYNEETKASVAEDVFIIGFPFGITVGNIFPVWKRASVASEMAFDIDDLPRFYVDTATRPGMSGSPVIKYEKRAFSLKNDTEKKYSGYFTKFVGIYSGRRIESDSDKDKYNDMAQLGFVWKAKVIDDLMAALPLIDELGLEPRNCGEARRMSFRKSGKDLKIETGTVAIDFP